MENIEVTQELILDLYSKYVLRNNKKPLNVFTFCDDNQIKESDFYFYYANFDQLEAHYLKFFMDQTLILINQDENFVGQIAKTKMLSFYFTFFEQLTLNRSLIMYLIGEDKDKMQNMKKLWALKKEFQMFIRSLQINESFMDMENEKMQKFENLKNKGVEELFWGHFLTTLKFWMEDTSSNFEKTDIFIEKSVDTSFEFLDVKPLKKLLDLGKFVFNTKVKNR